MDLWHVFVIYELLYTMLHDCILTFYMGKRCYCNLVLGFAFGVSLWKQYTTAEKNNPVTLCLYVKYSYKTPWLSWLG